MLGRSAAGLLGQPPRLESRFQPMHWQPVNRRAARGASASRLQRAAPFVLIGHSKLLLLERTDLAPLSGSCRRNNSRFQFGTFDSLAWELSANALRLNEFGQVHRHQSRPERGAIPAANHPMHGGTNRRPTEWILVDDGSTDSTGSIMDSAAAQHSWIKPSIGRTAASARRAAASLKPSMTATLSFHLQPTRAPPLQDSSIQDSAFHHSTTPLLHSLLGFPGKLDGTCRFPATIEQCLTF